VVCQGARQRDPEHRGHHEVQGGQRLPHGAVRFRGGHVLGSCLKTERGTGGDVPR